MGSVVQLKKQITNAYTDLLNSVDEKLSFSSTEFTKSVYALVI